MAQPHYNYISAESPIHRLQEFEAILANLDDAALLKQLKRYRWTGRPGHSLRALLRAYCVSFLLNLPSISALIRELQASPELCRLCGFDTIPHRTTLSRFIKRLSGYPELMQQVSVHLTQEIRPYLPGLGQEVAVDSTTVRSHSNPNRKHISDPEASWTAKNSAHAKDLKEWSWGYKLHTVADANYGLPLAGLTTTAKESDSPLLPTLIQHTESLYGWFHPSAVIADRGYDSRKNHLYLYRKGILPIIHIRRNANAPLYEGIYTEQGVPTCIGQVPMEYVRSDPQRGHLYRCGGCHLAGPNRGGIRYCNSEVWEDPRRDIRLFGAIRRNGPEWKELYAKRQAIERVFKSLKESRRLERHHLRGLQQVRLHGLMSMVLFQATVLHRLQTGRENEMRWMVRRVA